MRALAVLALALASCWRGSAAEPVETAPAPVAAKPVRGVTRPNTGPPLTSSSPGDLTRGHAPWDTDGGCLQCHVSVGAKAPLANQRCLGCHDHDNIATRIASGRGFHATGAVVGKPCEMCHREHRGRAYDNLGWQSVRGGRAGFNHALTGWPLPRQYRQTPCSQCHTRTNSGGHTVYLGLDRAQFP